MSIKISKNLFIQILIGIIFCSFLQINANDKYYYKQLLGHVNGQRIIIINLTQRDTLLCGTYNFLDNCFLIPFSINSYSYGDSTFLINDEPNEAAYKKMSLNFIKFLKKDDQYIGEYSDLINTADEKTFEAYENYFSSGAKFEVHTIARTAGDAKKDSICNVRVTYPLIIDYFNKAVQDSINEYIKSVISQKMIIDLTGNAKDMKDTPENKADELLSIWHSDMEMIDMEPKNQRDTISKTYNFDFYMYVTYNYDSIVSFSCVRSFLTPGVQSVTEEVFSMNLRNGKKIEINDVFPNGLDENIYKYAEDVFRNKYKISDKKSFKECGFSFPKNKFYINKNFFLTNHSVKFVYSPGEIASQDNGKFELELFYEGFKKMIHGNSILNGGSCQIILIPNNTYSK